MRAKRKTIRSGLRSLVLALACLGLGLVFADPSAALEVRIKIRTGLCAEAKVNCQAMFYLTPADGVKIEGQSADGKWLRIRHLASGQLGWVTAADVQIQAPSRLRPQQVQNLARPALALVNTPEGLALLEAGQLIPLDEAGLSLAGLPLKGLELMPGQPLHAFMTAARELRVFGLAELEKQKFLQEVQPALQPFPRYHNLLRMGEGPWSAALLPDQTLLLMGAGHSGLGQSLLLGLDAQYLPVLLLREAPELQNFLPPEVRANLRGESLRLQELEPDGTLVVSARHSTQRRDVLLRLQPKAASAGWVFLGQYFWPAQLPFRHDAPGLKLRFRHDGEQAFLLVATDGPGHLVYYAGGSDPLTVQQLEAPVLDAAVHQGQLWTLQEKSLTRWTPEMGK